MTDRNFSKKYMYFCGKRKEAVKGHRKILLHDDSVLKKTTSVLTDRTSSRNDKYLWGKPKEVM